MSICRIDEELNALAERDPTARVLIDETLRSIRLAAFATNPVIFGLNRMFQGLATEADGVSVFNDRARTVARLLEG